MLKVSVLLMFIDGFSVSDYGVIRYRNVVFVYVVMVYSFIVGCSRILIGCFFDMVLLFDVGGCD